MVASLSVNSTSTLRNVREMGFRREVLIGVRGRICEPMREGRAVVCRLISDRVCREGGREGSLKESLVLEGKCSRVSSPDLFLLKKSDRCTLWFRTGPLSLRRSVGREFDVGLLFLS